MIRSIAGAALALVLVACAGYPAPPARVASSISALPADPSTISVPITIRIPDGEPLLNAVVPPAIAARTWISVDSPVDDGFEALRALLRRAFPGPSTAYRYEIHRGMISIATARAPFTTSTSDLLITFPGTFAIAVRTGRSRFACGRLDRNGGIPFAVALDVRLTLQANWSLATQVPSASTGLPARCLLGPKRVDATPALQAVSGRFLDALQRQLTDTIGNGGKALRSNAEIFWALASQPFAIAPDTWFLLGPQRLPFEAPTVNGEHAITLGIRFGLVARPQVIVGPRPAVSLLPLPPLDANPQTADGFHVALDLRVPFDLLSRRITEKLRGTAIPIHPLGTLRIDQVEAYGTDRNRLAIRVGFSGAARGNAYFVGTPTFDRSSRTISMPDLDFTLATRNLLLNAAAPIVHSQRFVAMLREKATYDASDLLAENVAGVLRGFNRSFEGPPGTKIGFSGEVTQVEFGGIGLAGESLVLRAIVDGKARIAIDADT